MADEKICKNKHQYDSDDDNDDGNEDTGSDCGLSLEKLNIGSRKKLVIFSLNGLIVHRVYIHNKTEIPSNRTPDGTYGSYLVFKRPFCEEFMQFCFERFEVGIWSSAQEKNVDGVLDWVMGKLRRRLSFVWDQHECTDSGLKSLENKNKPLFLKELDKVWSYFCGKYSESDTLFIDDKPYKALLNPPNTGIFLESYDAENDNDKELDPKGELGKYLDGLADAKDVQIYVKGNPFGMPAISPTHPDWKFYSNVLRRLGKMYKR
ncbi:probable C-terminal domain small phosphatase [Pyrus x bretschneideri]|uniref:probable C-terminal domain small phosphatase n=1 Tax=Pyrus x bretschneideri TaxID=225117 RepID=UPI0020307735|nr:probable C-terminal domain small phosphatase [Pyrus x bretschneideri]